MTQPNDSILVTPGSGATVATHLVNGKEYQVVMVAEPSGHLLDSQATWYAWANDVAFAQNKHHTSIFNATGSGVVLKVRKLFAQNLAVAAVTGVMVRMDTFRITASSAGTTITPVAADTTNAALPAQVTVRTNGTITNGPKLFGFAVTNEEVGATGTLISGTHILAGLNWLPSDRSVQDLTLREGEGFTVQQITNTTVGTYGWLLVFTVE